MQEDLSNGVYTVCMCGIAFCTNPCNFVFSVTKNYTEVQWIMEIIIIQSAVHICKYDCMTMYEPAHAHPAMRCILLVIITCKCGLWPCLLRHALRNHVIASTRRYDTLRNKKSWQHFFCPPPPPPPPQSVAIYQSRLQPLPQTGESHVAPGTDGGGRGEEKGG